MSVSLAALAALGSLAATGIGAVGSAQANAEARSRLQGVYDEDMREYDRLLRRNYVDSPENAGLLRRLQEMQRDRYNQARATNVVAGGTDAHLAAMQGQGAKIVSDTANAIAERSQAYKDSVGEQRRVRRGQYAQQMFGLDQQKAQTIANAAGQASKAMAGIAAAGYDAENPFGMFGMDMRQLRRGALSEIDAQTAASMAATDKQLQDSLDRTLDDILRPLEDPFRVETIKR